MKPTKRDADIRGATHLTTDAIIGITNLVETMHQTILTLGRADQTRTRGITGLVYRNIRSVTQWVGGGIDLLLDQFSPLLGEGVSTPQREAVLAALNGVLGDHLVARNNPLAIPMRFRQDGRPIALDDPALGAQVRAANGRLLILVHGACMNDLLWERQGHDHGAALARELGYMPIYLHYNTGRHVSENGRLFAQLLQQLVDQLNQPVELTILTHSMGGLISRSACHIADESNYGWRPHLKRLLFLGTPHHGAPLEKTGNWVDLLLEISPYSAPFARLGKIRSAGVTDLRYGYVADADWQGQDRFQRKTTPKTAVPLPNSVACYTIAGTSSQTASSVGDQLLGDGLVTVDSALGKHRNSMLTLDFPEQHQWIARNVNHLALLNDTAVYEQINRWLTNERGQYVPQH